MKAAIVLVKHHLIDSSGKNIEGEEILALINDAENRANIQYWDEVAPMYYELWEGQFEVVRVLSEPEVIEKEVEVIKEIEVYKPIALKDVLGYDLQHIHIEVQ